MPIPSRLKKIVPLVFAVGLGVVAVLLNSQYLGQQRAKLEEERKKVLAQYSNPVEVVVAARDLPEGIALESAHLKTDSVPEKWVQPYAVRPHEIQSVIGQVTAAPIAGGEQVLSNKVRRPEAAPAGSTLSSFMPKGKRAVTIAVDTLSGVGGFVRAGDIVDMLWTLPVPPPPGGERPSSPQVVTVTLFQDVPVFAVGGEIAGGAPSKAGTPAGDAKQQFVTIGLTPQETSFLLFAREQGRIQLSLRPRADKGVQVSVKPADFNSLMELQLGMQPSKAPAADTKTTRQVEVYKGLQRSLVEVPEHE